jgi:hypothetical protein
MGKLARCGRGGQVGGAGQPAADATPTAESSHSNCILSHSSLVGGGGGQVKLIDTSLPLCNVALLFKSLFINWF